jgi:hypothetical protein
MRTSLCLAVLLSAIGWAVPLRAASPSLDANEVHRNLIRLDINLRSTLLSGSIVLCKAELVPEAGALTESKHFFAAGVAAGGSSRVCALEIPLCWTGNSLPSNVTLRFEIDAAKSPGAPLVALRRGVLRTALAGNGTSSSNLSVSLDTIP